MHRQANIRIDVFDAAGRLVTTVYDGDQIVGRHTHILRRRHLSAGVYFIRAQADARRRVMSLVVL